MTFYLRYIKSPEFLIIAVVRKRSSLSDRCVNKVYLEEKHDLTQLTLELRLQNLPKLALWKWFIVDCASCDNQLTSSKSIMLARAAKHRLTRFQKAPVFKIQSQRHTYAACRLQERRLQTSKLTEISCLRLSILIRQRYLPKYTQRILKKSISTAIDHFQHRFSALSS